MKNFEAPDMTLTSHVGVGFFTPSDTKQAIVDIARAV